MSLFSSEPFDPWSAVRIAIPLDSIYDKALLAIAKDKELLQDLFGEEDTNSTTFKDKLKELACL